MIACFYTSHPREVGRVIAVSETIEGRIRLKMCWLVVGAWLALGWIGTVLPVLAAAGALAGLFLVLFILIHGSMSYGWKGIGAYFLIGSVVGLGVEASSIATGFPFGSYVHHAPGLRVLGAPLVTIFGYAILGAPAWSLARLIVRADPTHPRGAELWTTPIIAAFILTGFDLAFDPIGHTVQHAWTFAHPGGQFGVPLSNFLGWLFTGWLIFQLFAAIERRFIATRAVRDRGYWLLPCLVWLGMAAQFAMMFAQAPAGRSFVGDRVFVTADVYEAGLITATMTMVFAALLGLTRLVGPASFGAARTAD